MNPTTLSIFSALAAAAWTVWTWKDQREKERQHEHDEMSVDFVNSLLFISQNLQRRLYKILEEDEISFYRKEFPGKHTPASPPAIELLHMMSVFFGWELNTMRYGPYTRDAKMISIIGQIGDIMESRTRFPGNAFRFAIADRHALAEAALRRVGDTGHRPMFVTIPRYKFEDDMNDPKSERASLYQCKTVRDMLEAFDRADSAENLEGRERLIALQNLLVHLLTYLEQEEGFRLQFGKRRMAGVDHGPYTDDIEIKVLHSVPGRVRICVPLVHENLELALHLESVLHSTNHVESVRMNPDAGCAVINFTSGMTQDKLLDIIAGEIDNRRERMYHRRVTDEPVDEPVVEAKTKATKNGAKAK
ncbi:MAG TPA: hypothetical protein V6C81_10595 [Planktothrix sp.]|jgi:hypothetical protein